jgi:phenylacetate-CoA ligase
LSEKAANNPQIDKNALKGEIQKRIHIVTGISADVEIVKPGELPRTEGKAKRVLDLRKGKM